MGQNIKVLARDPGDLRETELQDFIALVRAGGEVGGNVLEHNVRNAATLLTVRQGACLVGVAALKNPIWSYRKTITAKSGIEITARDFPFELGYIFVLPSARKKGIATKLCQVAVGARGSVGIFATTRVDNESMTNILRAVGFEQRGRFYTSRRGNFRLQLFLRQRGLATPPVAVKAK